MDDDRDPHRRPTRDRDDQKPVSGTTPRNRGTRGRRQADGLGGIHRGGDAGGRFVRIAEIGGRIGEISTPTSCAFEQVNASHSAILHPVLFDAAGSFVSLRRNHVPREIHAS
ncbi:hypothetical protein [Nocardia mangyaensis]|uniref:hypothetical protein n=1 Tax=Nocardia mangyaensis TaxID=2213200 RepID=UPI00267736A7|nr:hypothetical protein [Nocardia mangyaensis]MDO3648306.1 hypothetical protein [Nocardia mangyaensis]